MRHIKNIIMGLFIIGAVCVPATTTFAATNVLTKGCKSNPSSPICAGQSSSKTAADSNIKKLVNTMLYALGVVAVIMIIVGGIRYTVSGGDSGSIKGAKDTIMYAIVGLVVAILAFSIVNFVVGRF